MKEIKELISLLEDTTEIRIDYECTVVNYQGFSFLFRNPYIIPRESYITVKYSSKFSSAGFWRKIVRFSLENLDKIKTLDDLNLEDTKLDYLFGGALKTLVPSLEFGGEERLFDVWIFTRTPEGYMFPATFYYGKSGTSLGGWRMERAKEVFPPEFYSIINFSPFNFTSVELDAFIEALELSLKIVPVSDYYGIYKGDQGYSLMGVKDNKPFLMELGWSYDETEIERYLELAHDFG